MNFDLPPQFEGLCVIGDVHGYSKELSHIVEYAQKRNLYVLSLGDFIDRGPDSVGTLRIIKGLVGSGAGSFVRANHEDKLVRYVLGRPVQMDTHLQATLKEFDAQEDGQHLLDWMASVYRDAPYLISFNNYIFVHGAFHPDMLLAKDPEGFSNRLKSLALYGQTVDGKDKNGRPIKVYDWIDNVPVGKTVIIGHHAIAKDKVIKSTSKSGAEVLHLDTGISRGGKLSYIDIDRDGKVISINSISALDRYRTQTDCR